MLCFMTPHVQYLKKSRAELTSIIFYVRLFFCRTCRYSNVLFSKTYFILPAIASTCGDPASGSEPLYICISIIILSVSLNVCLIIR